MTLPEHTFHVLGFYGNKYLKRRIDQKQTTFSLETPKFSNKKIQYVHIKIATVGGS